MGNSTFTYADLVKDYAIADIDENVSPNYYGFVRPDGAWYILEETLVTGADTYKFIKGSKHYSTNWANRASLTYQYFHEAF